MNHIFSSIFGKRELVAATLLYVLLAVSGMFYGLPDKDRILSYNCDETTWLEALSLIKKENGYNPHPRLNAPTGYLLMYGAAVGVAGITHFLPLNESKEWFLEHPDQFARFYLVGRFLQLLCGLILLLGMWWVVKRVFGESPANIFALVFSVTPAFVSTSHFSQASLPVALFCNISIGALLWGGQDAPARQRWYYVAALFAGVALGTKFSALALVIPLAYYGIVFHLRSPRILALAVLFFLLGFISACPFSLLSPSAFVAAMLSNQKDNQLPPETLFKGVEFLFGVPLRFALGLALEILGVTAILYFIFQKKSFAIRLLLVWIFAFLAAVLRVGTIANVARIFVVIPAVVVLAALLLDKARGWVFRGAFALLFLVTLYPTLGIVRSRYEPLIQKESSAWIEQNITTDKTIGLLRNPFWYSPDVIVQSFHHPERRGAAYSLRVMDFSLEKAQAEPPDYFLISQVERGRCMGWGYPASCMDLVNWVEQGGVYELHQVFPREIEFHGWKWNRPEYSQYSFYDDHDLWRTSLYIYRRKNLVSATRS